MRGRRICGYEIGLVVLQANGMAGETYGKVVHMGIFQYPLLNFRRKELSRATRRTKKDVFEGTG